jgi:hypothetical protein
MWTVGVVLVGVEGGFRWELFLVGVGVLLALALAFLGGVAVVWGGALEGGVRCDTNPWLGEGGRGFMLP